MLTFKKSHLAVLLFLVIAVFLMSTTLRDSQFILRLSEKLKTYHSLFPLEKIYLQTDKDVYRPGETVWFKAYAVNSVSYAPSGLSKKLFVHLYDNEGTVLYKDIYLIDSAGCVQGEFSIPNPLNNMECTLMAYTGWQRNGNPGMSFLKHIKITAEVIPDLQADVFPDYQSFQEGHNALIYYKLSNHGNSELTGYYVRYTLKAGKKNLAKGKDFIENKEGAVIMFEMPELNNSENITLFMEFDYKDQHLEFSKNLDISQKPIQVGFYPEDGNFHALGKQKVIIKTSYGDKTPFAAQGFLYNSKDEKITTVKTNSLGLGNVQFSPEKSEKYCVKLAEKTKSEKKYHFSQISESRYSLALQKITKDYATFELKSSNENVERLSIVTHIRGEIYYAALTSLKNTVLLDIPLATMPEGIMQVCIYNSNSQLIAHRLIYVNRQVDLNIALETDKQVYTTGENVTLKIKSTQLPEKGSKAYISISVADHKLKQTGIGIDDYLNFGYDAFALENYLNNFSKHSDQINDYLLTRSDISENWLALLDTDKINKPAFFSGDGILGYVTDRKGNQVSNAQIQAANLLTLDISSTASDDSGWFYIPYNRYQIADQILELSAKSEDKNTTLKIHLDNTYHNQMKTHALKYIGASISQTASSSVSSKCGLSYVHSFPTVKTYIEEKQPAVTKQMKPDYSSEISVLDIILRLKQYTLVDNKIVFAGGFNSINNQQGALIVIDGIKMGEDASNLQSVNPADIADIQVSTDVTEIQKYTAFNTIGVIVITTKQGEFTKSQKKYEKVENNGFHVSKQFKAPVYASVNNKEIIEKDKRTTLFWKPDIVLDESGSTAVSFYTSSIKSTYEVRVEGVDENGNVGCVTLRFDVK